MAKKILSLVLAVVMLATVVSVGMFATSADPVEPTGTTVLSGTDGWTKTVVGGSTVSLMGVTEGKYSAAAAGIAYFGAVGKASPVVKYTHTAVDLGDKFDLSFRYAWSWGGKATDTVTNHLNFTLGDLVIKVGRDGGKTDGNNRTIVVSYKGTEIIDPETHVVKTTVDYATAAEIDIACNAAVKYTGNPEDLTLSGNNKYIDSNGTKYDLYNDGTYWTVGNDGGTSTRSSLNKFVDVTVEFDRGVLAIYTGAGEAKSLYAKYLISDYDFSDVAPVFDFNHGSWYRSVVMDVYAETYEDVVAGSFDPMGQLSFADITTGNFTVADGTTEPQWGTNWWETRVRGIGSYQNSAGETKSFINFGFSRTNSNPTYTYNQGTYDLSDGFSASYDVHYLYTSSTDENYVALNLGGLTIKLQNAASQGGNGNSLAYDVLYNGTSYGRAVLGTYTTVGNIWDNTTGWSDTADPDYVALMEAIYKTTNDDGSAKTRSNVVSTYVNIELNYANNVLTIVATGTAGGTKTFTVDLSSANVDLSDCAWSWTNKQTTAIATRMAIANFEGSYNYERSVTNSFGDLSDSTRVSGLNNDQNGCGIATDVEGAGDVIYKAGGAWEDIVYEGNTAYDLGDVFEYSFNYYTRYLLNDAPYSEFSVGDITVKFTRFPSGSSAGLGNAVKASVYYRGAEVAAETQVNSHIDHGTAIKAAVTANRTEEGLTVPSANYDKGYNIRVSFDNGRLVVKAGSDSAVICDVNVGAYDFSEAKIGVKLASNVYDGAAFGGWSGSYTVPATCETENADNLSYSEWFDNSVYNVNTATDGYEHRICHNCGEIQTKASMTCVNVNLNASDSIAINFLAVSDFLDTYADATATYEFKGETYTVTPEAKTIQGKDYQVFTVDGITPALMGSSIAVTLKGTDPYTNEEVSKVVSYSVKDYCTTLLTLYADAALAGDATANKYVTLAADMLKYGGAAEVYIGRQANFVDAVLNTAIGETGSTWADFATASPRVLTEADNKAALTSNLEGEAIAWYGASVNLREKISLLLAFNGEFAEGYKVVATVDGVACDEYVPEVYNGGTYSYFYFSDLNPAQLDSEVKLTVVDAEGNAVSEELTYSVATYAYLAQANQDTMAKEYALTSMMMNYGDAVKAYAN